MKLRTTLTALVLSYAILTTACASNFATDLRLALAVSAPFIESLNLGNRRAAIVADFTELGTDAATMAESLNACAGNKGCELNAVGAFEASFEIVANRDFNSVPKLSQVESLVRGILAAARIYYGARPAAGIRTASQVDPLKDIKAKTAQLKALTHGGS